MPFGDAHGLLCYLPTVCLASLGSIISCLVHTAAHELCKAENVAPVCSEVSANRTHALCVAADFNVLHARCVTVWYDAVHDRG